jgi:undecaprenyl-phosphate 4-deoxy-4-formamido-L-arabinose transferase
MRWIQLIFRGAIDMPSISVVIPVYNSEGTIRDLCSQLLGTLKEICDDFEIILVEDCSRDRSWEMISAMAQEEASIRGIKLKRNYGQHNALLCGIRDTKNEIIVTMDDDLQNPVSEIPLLLAELEKGFDVVYGAPKKEQHGMFRDFASRVTKLALKGAMGVEIAANVSAFRAFRSHLKSAFEDYRSPAVQIDVLLTWATSRFSVVKVLHQPRGTGTSNYNLRKLAGNAFDLLTGFSALPLRLASFVGFLITIFGFLVLVWVLGRYFITGVSVPGFPFLASIIAIFSGAQMFALGIFGEYLARIHFRTLDRPTYSVHMRTNDE